MIWIFMAALLIGASVMCLWAFALVGASVAYAAVWAADAIGLAAVNDHNIQEMKQRKLCQLRAIAAFR